MKRTKVYLEESVDLALSQIAKRRGRPKAELIRESLSEFVRREQISCSPPHWVGMGRSDMSSGISNWAERDEELLLELLEREYEEILSDFKVRQQR